MRTLTPGRMATPLRKMGTPLLVLPLVCAGLLALPGRALGIVVAKKEFSVLKIDLDVDTNRNGSVEEEADEDGEDEFTRERGAVVLHNSDDDDNDDQLDCDNSFVDGGGDSNDLARLVIRKQDVGELPANTRFILKIPATLRDYVRVFDHAIEGATEILGKDAGTIEGDDLLCVLDSSWVIGTSPTHTLGVEALALPHMRVFPRPFVTFDGAIPITIEYQSRQSGPWTSLASDTVQLQVAPFVMPWNGQTVEAIYADDSIASLLFSHVTGIPVHSEEVYDDSVPRERSRFIQDYVEFGNTSAPSGKRIPVVANIDTSLDPWQRNLCKRENRLGYYLVDNATADGGTYEVTPPHQGAPLGRLMAGSKQLTSTFISLFMKKQLVQLGTAATPLEINTSWLEVAHTDELVCFVPVGNSYRVLVPSPSAALDVFYMLWAGGDGNALMRVATRKADSRFTTVQKLLVSAGTTLASDVSLTDEYITVSEAVFAEGDVLRVDDEYMVVIPGGSGTTVKVQRPGLLARTHSAGKSICALTELARQNIFKEVTDVACPEEEIETMVNTQLLPAINGGPGSVIRLPVLFARPEGETVWVPYTSNVVNCLVVQNKTIMADPFGPLVGYTDHFKARINSLMTGVATTAYVDAWRLHELGGGVHCGSNAVRAPLSNADWWQAWPAE